MGLACCRVVSYKHLEMENAVALITPAVVVAIEHLYNDNDGATSIAVLWDGVNVNEECYANGYNRGSWDDRSVDATYEQIVAAGEAYREQKRCTTNNTFLWCDVILQRSSKAPNGVPLSVVDHERAVYQRNGWHTPERVCVLVDGRRVWVGITCVKSVAKYAMPRWARPGSIKDVRSKETT